MFCISGNSSEYPPFFETRRQLTAGDAAMKETDDEVLKASLQMEFEDKSVQFKEQEGQLKAF